MTAQEFMADIERRIRDAEEDHSTAPVALVLGHVLRDARAVGDWGGAQNRVMETAEIAALFAVSEGTVAGWCRDGLLRKAEKLADGTQGEWRVPAWAVFEVLEDPSLLRKRRTRPSRKKTTKKRNSSSHPPEVHVAHRRTNKPKGRVKPAA